ncbi:MAG: hypothetical protein K8S87_06900 [Planctomycetes bacterium]|nr:hypothetical protein [Planctomycetota bacterium]
MKKTLILAFVAFFVVISGCSPAKSAGLMEIEPIGQDKTMFAASIAKITLNNDTNKTLFFRMLDSVNNAVIGDDMQLNAAEQKDITPNANQYYNYIIFSNNNDKDPIYRFNNAWFSAGYTYTISFSAAISSRKK